MTTRPSSTAKRPTIVIVGGGFAGLYAAKHLESRRVEAHVVLIDKRNHHLFQPLLYQVATAGLGAPDIAAPIRRILRRHKDTTVLLGEVVGIDLEQRVVRTARDALAYDHLVLATGVTNHYFGHDDWEEHAPGLKSLHDALEIRRRVLLAFEAAEAEHDPEAVAALLTFVVVGGGPTGVELAGALAEIARHTMARQFRTFDPAAARVILVEGGPRILPGMDESLSKRAQLQLERLGVTVWTGRRVSGIDAAGVDLGAERIAARTVLWGAGIGARALERSLGAKTDRMGRLHVEPDLSLPGHPEVFVVGDVARVELGSGDEAQVVPGVAPAAIQMGKHAADNVLARIAGRPTAPFRYVDKGSLATIGRKAGVAQLGSFRFSGFAAWVLWLFVHIFFLIGFRNRVVVMLSWSLSYFFWTRGARVILERPLALARPQPHNTVADTSAEADRPTAGEPVGTPHP